MRAYSKVHVLLIILSRLNGLIGMLLNEEAIYANETDALLPSSSNNDDLNDLSYIGRDAIKRRSSRSGSIVMWRISLRYGL